MGVAGGTLDDHTLRLLDQLKELLLTCIDENLFTTERMHQNVSMWRDLSRHWPPTEVDQTPATSEQADAVYTSLCHSDAPVGVWTYGLLRYWRWTGRTLTDAGVLTLLVQHPAMRVLTLSCGIHQLERNYPFRTAADATWIAKLHLYYLSLDHFERAVLPLFLRWPHAMQAEIANHLPPERYDLWRAQQPLLDRLWTVLSW